MTSSFNPLQEPDLSSEFDQNYQAQQAALQTIYGEAAKDAQAQVTYTKQQADARNSAIEKLSSFSGQLMEQLVERKKKFNEEEMNQGMLDAFFAGPDETQLASVDEQEQELVTSTRAVNTLADKIKEQDGHSLVAQEVRRAGSWREYGKYIGQVQNTVGMLSMQRGFAEANMPVTLTNSDGTQRQLSYAQLETITDYQAWQNEFVRKFLTQFPGINPEVAQKYIFPELRKSLKTSAIEWNQDREEAIEAERKSDAKDALVNASGSMNIGQIYLKLWESKVLTRKELSDAAKLLHDQDLLTDNDIENIKLADFTNFADGQPTTLGKAFERDFAWLETQKAEKLDKDFKTRNQQIDRNKTRFEEELNQLEGLTNAELRALQDRMTRDPNDLENYIPPADLKDILDKYQTREERDDEVSREILNALYLDRGGNLIESDLKGHSATIRKEFGSLVRTPAEAQVISSLTDTYSGLVQSAVKDLYMNTDGLIPVGKNNEFERRKLRAVKAFKDEFTKNLKSGEFKSPEDAAKAAEEFVRKKLEVKNSTYLLGAEQVPSMINKASVVVEAKKLLMEDRDAYKSQVFEGSEPYLEELKQFAITGRGRIPQFYHDLSVGSELDAWAFADAQLKAANYKAGLGRPPVENQIDAFSPRTQQLLRNYNTPSRTFRAVQNELGTGGAGNTKWFLDTIASKESASYGEYDAYNLGGANGGYTAYGSGNSAVDQRFGVPVSQLTLGELMALGSSNRIFAAGRYQFIPTTLREVFNRLNSQGVVGTDTVFDAEIQDLFAMTRAQQRISWPGQNSIQGLINEWRGLKFADPAKLERMLQILNNEPYLQPQALMPGLTIPVW